MSDKLTKQAELGELIGYIFDCSPDSVSLLDAKFMARYLIHKGYTRRSQQATGVDLDGNFIKHEIHGWPVEFSGYVTEKKKLKFETQMDKSSENTAALIKAVGNNEVVLCNKCLKIKVFLSQSSLNIKVTASQLCSCEYSAKEDKALVPLDEEEIEKLLKSQFDSFFHQVHFYQEIQGWYDSGIKSTATAIVARFGQPKAQVNMGELLKIIMDSDLYETAWKYHDLNDDEGQVKQSAIYLTAAILDRFAQCNDKEN